MYLAPLPIFGTWISYFSPTLSTKRLFSRCICTIKYSISLSGIVIVMTECYNSNCKSVCPICHWANRRPIAYHTAQSTVHDRNCLGAHRRRTGDRGLRWASLWRDTNDWVMWYKQLACMHRYVSFFTRTVHLSVETPAYCVSWQGLCHVNCHIHVSACLNGMVSVPVTGFSAIAAIPDPIEISTYDDVCDGFWT